VYAHKKEGRRITELLNKVINRQRTSYNTVTQLYFVLQLDPY